MADVSVALCTYNSSRFIEQQLRSILTQTVLPAEVIISDDGSSDNTLDLVQAVFAGSSVSLRIVGRTKLGVTANFQRAVEACASELIALSDHDDVWRHDRIARAIPSFREDPGLLLQHSNARLVDAVGHPMGVSLFEALRVTKAEREKIETGRAFEAYLRRNLVTGATVIFRRTLLESALPFPPSWLHDEWLAIIAAATGTVQVLDEALIDYRQHGNNEVGVAKSTLRYRARRMLEPRGQRYVRLADRSAVLVSRLEGLVADPTVLDLAKAKERFENLRSGFPDGRAARLRSVLRELRGGSYERLSSQGKLDALRDLLQST